MKDFAVVLALVIGCQAVFGAEILQGYMVSKDGTKCLSRASSAAVVSTTGDLSPAKLQDDMCTLMSLQEGVADGQFIMDIKRDSQHPVILTPASPTTFTRPATQLTFTPEGTMTALTGITSADVSDLTTVGTSVYVADVDDQTDNTDCLKLDGTYVQGSDTDACADQLWYFVLAACTGTNCATCVPDPAMCSTCAADEAKNTAGTACVACSGETDCLTCNLDSDDNIECLTCDTSKYLTSSGNCDAVTTTTTESTANSQQSFLLAPMGLVILILSNIF